MDNVTWAQLVQEEPRLADLLRETQAVQDDGKKPMFCANDIWYDSFRDRIYTLAGWYVDASKPEWMKGQDAFDLAYRTVYDALPDCRNCLCL